MRDSLECPNCQRKLAAPTAEVEAVRCSGCGVQLQLDAPLQDAEAKLAIQSTPHPEQKTPGEINPIPRIARKRSFILRYLDPALPRTRRMNRAFIIGACIPAT